jgi:tricarballylate dehydrogenase
VQRDVYDVVVVGAGNAALCAALAAQEEGARVLVLERAPRHARGGNSYFTGGLVRFPFHGMDDLRALIPDITDDEAAGLEVGTYDEDAYFEDLARVTEYLADAELLGIMAEQAYPTMLWLKEKNIRFGLAIGRQAFRSGEKFRFWGNAPVEYAGGGVGLVDMLFDAVGARDIDVWYDARARALIVGDDGAVAGVRVRRDGKNVEVAARAVVLAAGGFEANPAMRAQYLGPNWDVAKVRGTEYNTGDGIRMALDIGAQPYGHWSGCHAVAWDLNAPPTGDRKVGDSFQKHSYPFGVIVNKLGHRFVDEGADFRNYTYAKYGKEILKQPDMAAFQIFDSKVMHLLRDEYRIQQVTKAESATFEGLAEALEIQPETFARTMREFNAACGSQPFDPTVKDGRATTGIEPPKSNWAMPIDSPPYVGFAVTCGITFTFGGLRIDNTARVIDEDQRPIEGLTAAGELIGGLFYHNYAGGTGLATGAVFGKIAGHTAARSALKLRASG